MNLRRRTLAIALASALLIAVPASSAPSGPPTQVWIDVATHSMPGMPDLGAMGGLGGMAARMMGGGENTLDYPDARTQMMPGKFFDIAMLNRPAPGQPSEQQVPAGLGLGPSLPLLPPKTVVPTEQVGTNPEMPDAEIHLKYYWGCGGEVRAGQPRELHLRAKGGKFEFSGDPMQGRYAPDRDVRPDPSYVLWPNPKTRNRAPANASLAGAHRITGPGVPESLKFELQPAADFMPKIALTQSGDLATGMTLGWQPVDRSKAYFLHAVSMQDKTTIVLWSSAEVPDAGSGIVDFLTGGQVDRWLKEKVLLPPSTTSCAIPKGIFAGGGNATPPMLSMIAYGPETHIAWPPKPADPKQPWNPEWNVRVRTKSTAGAMLGMDLSGMEGMDTGAGGTPQEPGQKPAEESTGKKLLKGLLRNL